MKFFIDTAKVEDIIKANDMGIICGVTTNPSLIAKEGRDFGQVIQEIEQVSFEDVRAVTQEILSAPCAAALVGKGADKVDLSAFNL